MRVRLSGCAWLRPGSLESGGKRVRDNSLGQTLLTTSAMTWWCPPKVVNRLFDIIDNDAYIERTIIFLSAEHRTVEVRESLWTEFWRQRFARHAYSTGNWKKIQTSRGALPEEQSIADLTFQENVVKTFV